MLTYWLPWAGLVGCLAGICYSDFVDRRIPNWLVGVLFCLAIVLHAVSPSGAGLFFAEHAGSKGLVDAGLGAVAAFVFFLALHIFRLMGAGDVKLMGALGAVFGLAALPGLLLSIFLAGGFLVAVRALNRARRLALIGNLRLILFQTVGGGVGPRFDPKLDTADRMPFGVAMALGSVAYAIWQRFGIA